VVWRTGLEKLDDEELARELLRSVDPLSRAGNVAEVVAERLSEGVIERMARRRVQLLEESDPRDECCVACGSDVNEVNPDGDCLGCGERICEFCAPCQVCNDCTMGGRDE